ncbi:hypothetical protein SAMN02745900_04474 [Pseudomonas sp. URIL14HWK12:I8]|nr:hypothetical protein SAMN02745900_04474 [Pseudomonas sp. URIL14HWK12:I8]
MQKFQYKIEHDGASGYLVQCEFPATGELRSALEWVQLAARRDGAAGEGSQPSFFVKHRHDSVSITISKPLALEAAVGWRLGVVIN